MIKGYKSAVFIDAEAAVVASQQLHLAGPQRVHLHNVFLPLDTQPHPSSAPGGPSDTISSCSELCFYLFFSGSEVTVSTYSKSFKEKKMDQFS